MDFEEVSARAEIIDVLYRYARAVDRMDPALLRSCYFPDAIDEHIPFFAGPAGAFVDWVMASLGKLSFSRHEIANVLIAYRGSEAAVESYWTGRLRATSAERQIDIVRGGRYLDKFEKRAGEWRIAHRRSLPEFSRTTPAAPEDLGIPVYEVDHGMLEIRGTRDRFDPSYQLFGDDPEVDSLTR